MRVKSARHGIWSFGSEHFLSCAAGPFQKGTAPLAWLLSLGLSFALVLTCDGVESPALHYVNAASLTPKPPYTNWATAASVIQDAVDAAGVDDEIIVTNGIYATGGRVVGLGLLTNRVVLNKRVILRSVNGPALTIIQGWQVPETTNGDAAVRCVYLDSQATLIGFTLTKGATRAGGSNAADLWGGGAWCDSTHAVITNCVLTANSAAIGGGGVYAGTLDECLLSGNTKSGTAYSILRNCVVSGNSGDSGGGVFQSDVTNCVLLGNSAFSGGAASHSVLNYCTLVANSAISFGGGAYQSTLVACSVVGNSSLADGGGVANSSLVNCIINGNSAGRAGGAHECSLTNCTVVRNQAATVGGVKSGNLANSIVYYNTASVGEQNVEAALLSFCCTTPAAQGSENITNEPLFVNLSYGDFRLQTNSPCINSGNNSFAATTTDLEGNPRIQGGTVDIGAFEIQSPRSLISYAWLQQHGLPIDGTVDFEDSDGDGMNNWQEWIAGSDPLSSLSVLTIQSLSVQPAGVALHWHAETNRSYFVARSTNLTLTPHFERIATNIVAQFGNASFVDTNRSQSRFYFYRVGVQ